MTLSAAYIREFLSAHRQVVLAQVTGVRGSAPREAGAFMLISATARIGTIGGGALEHLCIDRARRVIREGLDGSSLDIPLGPEIGQCCGGRVDVALSMVDRTRAAALIEAAELEAAFRPHVYVFGAGHVGQALARALALLPLHVHAVDTRPDELAGLPETVEALAVPMPEAVVRAAPIGSAYVIVTHDHALDFLIAYEALARFDSPYVGMVGSKSKRAKFRSWYLGEGGDPAAVERLVLPIGGRAYPEGLGDKRPEVIAALAAAEIMVHIGRGEAAVPGKSTRVVSGATDGR
jgi:xanthine dehydrogenase accessory factor